MSVCLSGTVRYEKQLQEEELSLQQQRRRLYKEVAEEKEMLAQLIARWVQRFIFTFCTAPFCARMETKKKKLASCKTADKMLKQLVIVPQCCCFFVLC